MQHIKAGEFYGVYEVINKANKHTSRGSRCYECKCKICGSIRIFSEGYLLKLRPLNECICDKEQMKLDLRREFEYIKRNYGRVNLCGECKHFFTCVRHKYNAIDKKFMKSWRIEKVKDWNRTRNMIVILECDKFEFDWGNIKPNSKDFPLKFD